MKKIKIKSLPKAQLLGQLNYKPSLGLKLNANPYQNAFKPKPTLQKSLLDELTKENNSKFAVSESTQPIAKMPQLPEEWKGKTSKEIEALIQAQKEYDALPNAIRNPDVLTADKRSDLEKFARRAWTVASSPMHSIATVNRGGYIPSGYLGMHSAYESPNPMATVVDLALGLPAFIANAGARQGEQLVNNPLEYGLTNTLGVFDPKMRDQAISNYLDLAAVIPAARAASPLLRNAGKSVITRTGEVKNIIRPPKPSMNDASLYDAAKSEQLLKYIYDEDFLRNSNAWDIKYWRGQNIPQSELLQRIANKLDYPADLSKLGEVHGGFGTVVPTTHDPAKLIKFGVLNDWEAKAPSIFKKLEDIGSTVTDPYIGLPHKSHVFPDLQLPIAHNSGPGSLVQILKRVPGYPLRKYADDLNNLQFIKNNLTEESIANTVNRLKFLQKNNLGIDWQNPDNFLFDPITGEVGIVDIAAMPKKVLSPNFGGESIRWFNTLGVDYGDIYEKAIGAVIDDPIRAAMPLRLYKPQIDAVRKAIGPNYKYLDEIDEYPRVWFKNPHTRQVWESAFDKRPSPQMPKTSPQVSDDLMKKLMYNLKKAGFKKNGGTTLPKEKKKQAGFKILTDANGKYVFVNT